MIYVFFTNLIFTKKMSLLMKLKMRKGKILSLNFNESLCCSFYVSYMFLLLKYCQQQIERMKDKLLPELLLLFFFSSVCLSTQKVRSEALIGKYNLQYTKLATLPGSFIKGLKLSAEDLLIGRHERLNLWGYNISNWIDEFTLILSQIHITSVELDMTNHWIFKGDDQLNVEVFGQQDNTYVQVQVINLKEGSFIAEIDINSHGYLGISYLHGVSLQKWNGVQFEDQVKIPAPLCYGVKVCEDNSLLFTTNFSFFRYQNNEGHYEQTQQIDLYHEKHYYLTATDDCKVVSISEYTGSSAVLIILWKDEKDSYFLFGSEKSPNNYNYRKSGINSDGDVIVIPGQVGVDVWVYNSDDHRYSLSHTFQQGMQSGRLSATINDRWIAFEGSGGVEVIEYTSIHNPSGYFGNKADLVIEELSSLSFRRKIIDIRISGEYLGMISKYDGAYLFRKSESGGYIEVKEFKDTLFLSSIDIQHELGVVVQGNYDGRLLVYKDKGLGFISTQNISTASQIMHLDLNSQGQLALGHMNGALSKYTWNITSESFLHSQTLNHEGSRVINVKMCLDGSMIMLIQSFGWYFFKVYSAEGTQLFSQQLPEFLDVRLASTDDCSLVLISSALLMKVDIYRKQPNTYRIFSTITEQFPLSVISVNSDGDVFLVSRHTDRSSALYKYDECMGDYELTQVVREGEDDYAVVITDEEIAIGNQDGSVQAYHYYYQTKTCDAYGYKQVQEVEQVATFSAPRSIDSLSMSGNFLLAHSQYSHMMLYQLIEGQFSLVDDFPDSHFIADVSISSSTSTFAAGSLQKHILIYKQIHSGYTVNQTIQTESQVVFVEVRDNTLLAGMMNGNIIQYQSDGFSPYTMKGDILSHEGMIEGVKLCPNSRILALLEKEGRFQFLVYEEGTLSARFSSQFQLEYIQIYLSATQDCGFVAISGVTMSAIQVFRDQDGYALFQTIQAEQPLSSLAIDNDGDIIMVGTITAEYSLLYQFTQCTEGYAQIAEISSGTFDKTITMDNQFTVQGNQKGGILVSRYLWNYNSTCPHLLSSSPLLKNIFPSQFQRKVSKPHLNPNNQAVNFDSFKQTTFSITFTSLGVLVIIFVCVFVKRKKTPNCERKVEKQMMQSANSFEKKPY